MQFSNSTTKLGIVERARKRVKLDSVKFPIEDIVGSCNDYLDMITGYAIGADKRFQWDDTNQTKLPEGTTNLVANQSDYSWLTDEQGNKILTLNRVDILDASGVYRQLVPIDQVEIPGATEEFLKTAGLPAYYDKIADNIVRLYPKPIASVTAGLKFYFQRTASYFTAADTTKEPGVAGVLHKGFYINAAYDCAETNGLIQLQALAIDKQAEYQNMVQYFQERNPDEPARFIRGVFRSSR